MRARFVNEVNFERGGDPRDTLLGDYWRKRLHQEMTDNNVWSTKDGGYSPNQELSYAVQNNLGDYVEKILSSNPELKNEHYLLQAVQRRNIEIVKILLAAGIDAEGKFNYPLRYAAEGKGLIGSKPEDKEKRQKSEEIAKILVAAGAPNDGYSRGMGSDNTKIIDQEFEFEIEDDDLIGPDEEYPTFTINADFYYDPDHPSWGRYELDGYYLQKGSYDPKYKAEINKYMEKNEKSIRDHMEKNVGARLFKI